MTSTYQAENFLPQIACHAIAVSDECHHAGDVMPISSICCSALAWQLRSSARRREILSQCVNILEEVFDVLHVLRLRHRSRCSPLDEKPHFTEEMPPKARKMCRRCR